jgi:hypothetical protein
MYHWRVLEETSGLCRASYRCVEMHGQSGAQAGETGLEGSSFQSTVGNQFREMQGCLLGRFALGNWYLRIAGPDKGEEA